jgi:iron uptake system component EfeO
VTRTLLALAAVGALALTACSSNEPADDATTITVESSADACTLSETSAPAGDVVFEVTNTGDETTEFYLYAENGEDIVSEVEDITPDASRDLTVDLDEGSYVAACKPGMTGDGIREDFTVSP